MSKRPLDHDETAEPAHKAPKTSTPRCSKHSTLREALGKVLPSIPEPPSPGSQQQPSSKTISRVEAPRFFIDNLDWESKWREFRENYSEAPDIDVDNHEIPLTVDLSNVSSKADVVRLAGLYLIYPVQVAFNHVHKSNVSSEAYMSNSTGLRKDLAWRDERGNVFMHTEFKKRGYLDVEKWEKQAKEAGESDARGEDSNAHGAVKHLLKHIKGYADKEHIFHSSLCDYENLILFHFSPDYKEVRITIVNKENFGRSLVGMLLMAYENVHGES